MCELVVPLAFLTVALVSATMHVNYRRRIEKILQGETCTCDHWLEEHRAGGKIGKCNGWDSDFGRRCRCTRFTTADELKGMRIQQRISELEDEVGEG